MLLEKGGKEMVGVGPCLCCICRGTPVFRDPLSLASCPGWDSATFLSSVLQEPGPAGTRWLPRSFDVESRGSSPLIFFPDENDSLFVVARQSQTPTLAGGCFFWHLAAVICWGAVSESLPVGPCPREYQTSTSSSSSSSGPSASFPRTCVLYC